MTNGRIKLKNIVKSAAIKGHMHVENVNLSNAILTFGLLPPMAPGRMDPVSW